MSTPELPDKAPSYGRPYANPNRTGYPDTWLPEPEDEGMSRAGMARAEKRRELRRLGAELVRQDAEREQRERLGRTA
jgi:hypothetical protein